MVRCLFLICKSGSTFLASAGGLLLTWNVAVGEKYWLMSRAGLFGSVSRVGSKDLRSWRPGVVWASGMVVTGPLWIVVFIVLLGWVVRLASTCWLLV